MNTYSFTTPFFSHHLAEELGCYNAAAEKAGCLLPEQLAVIYRQNWFKMFVPRSLGGMELTLPEGLQLEEDLARIDGSLGWTVTLCSGATMFAGYLEPAIVSDIFSDSQVCFGGSGRPGGVASVTNGGYEISGYWQYATGAPHTTIFTANCFIEQNGKRLTNEDGSPVIRSFFFKKAEVELYNDWQTMGLIATAGHAFKVNHLQVQQSRCFVIDGLYATIDQPIYQYPFLQFAEATLAVNTCGMALHFLDICGPVFREKERGLSETVAASVALPFILAHARTRLHSLRQQFYEAVEASWQQQTDKGVITGEALRAVSICSRMLAAGARGLVQELFPYCGMQAANPALEVNRVWRDLHTASQHSLLTFPVA